MGFEPLNRVNENGSRAVNRPLVFVRSLVVPVLVFGLGVSSIEAMNRIIWSMRGVWWATVMAWRIGPWGRFPMPFDIRAFERARDSDDYSVEKVLIVISAYFLFGLILCVGHWCVFGVTFLIYRRFGWPGYLADLGDRIARIQVWQSAVRRGWWVLPAFGFARVAWEWIDLGQSYSLYRWAFTGLPFDYAMLCLGAATYARISGGAIIAAVRSEVRADEVRCCHCGYLLRGLSESKCPECGRAAIGTVPPRFELGRGRRRGRRAAAWIAVSSLTLTMPAWVPALVTALPLRVARQLPPPIQQSAYWPDWSVPLRIGAICTIRDQAQTGVLWVRQSDGPRFELHWWRWNECGFWDRAPDSSGVATIAAVGGTEPIQIGGLSIAATLTRWARQSWITLSTGHPNWDVTVQMPEDAPAELRRLVEQCGTGH